MSSTTGRYIIGGVVPRLVALAAMLTVALLVLAFGPVSHAQAAQRTCQDNSKTYGCWEFNKWIPDDNPVYSGGSQAYTSIAGKSASFSFTGTTIKWITSKGPDYGKTAVYLDGNEVKVFDGYASSYSHRVAGYSRSGLANKKHTIKIVNTGKKNSNATGTFTGIDAFVVGSTTVQDISPRITYGAWKGVKDSRASGGTYRISSAPVSGAAQSFTVTGPSLTFVTATGPNMSRKATVAVVDATTGVPVAGSGNYDLYSSSLRFQRTITFSGFSSNRSYDLIVYSDDGRPVVFDAVQANYKTS